jgi:uroporphyrinogen-III decarboxylase
MAMLQYFSAFGDQNARLRTESGTVSAIAGILKAPMDILADKLRGYIGLLEDLRMQPQKVLAACEALAPHLLHVAQATADPDKQVPVSIWMHRGCVPFVTPGDFDSIYWPTLKPIIQELWASGHQTLFYAEGDWNHHLHAFAELPAGSIVYHVDQGDLFEAHEALGEKFCLSGGIPNVLLAFGSADEVRQHVKQVIDRVAREGGYILDASAILQNDASVENIRAMTDFARDYGVYSRSSARPTPSAGRVDPILPPGSFMAARDPQSVGTCTAWDTKRADLPQISGNEDLVRRIWENVDGLANMYIWQLLLSF